MSSEGNNSGRRELTGRVVSDKMDKTVVVEVQRRYSNPNIGNMSTGANPTKHTMRTIPTGRRHRCDPESRPLSKTKRWTVLGPAQN